MAQLRQSEFCNRLLARLPPEEFELLAAGLEPVAYTLGATLVRPDEPFSHVLFLERGVASIVVISPAGQVAEAGIIGREGFVAPAVVLGSPAVPQRIEMQIAGDGHRVGLPVLLAARDRGPALREAMQLFAHCLMVQASYTALSNAVHKMEERLARWLLMCHDRSDSDELALTHRFMSVMLSVRRPSVTSALHVLEGQGLVRSERGYVTIANRAALEDFAADAHGKPEAEYRRLLGPL